MKRFLNFGIILGIVALLMGCGVPRTVNTGTTVAQPTAALPNGVSITSQKVAMAGDLQKLSFVVSNGKTKPQRIKYKVLWFDAQGFPASSNDTYPWTPVELYPQTSKVLTSVAPTATAVTYQIQMTTEK